MGINGQMQNNRPEGVTVRRSFTSDQSLATKSRNNVVRNIFHFSIPFFFFNRSIIYYHPRDKIANVVKLINKLPQHHFFREEPMCKASSLLEDPTSVNDYLELIRTWMNDTTSIVAVSLKSGRVIGVAVTRVNSRIEKTDTYQRVQVLLRSISI